jgi:ribonuclease D
MPETEFMDAEHAGEFGDCLAGIERIALDTEFMRERTYFPQLCLVQVATPDRIWCVDPLGATGIEQAWESLMQCSWVVHSGRQDLEVMYLASGRMPAGLFDTQVAAALLGYAPQLGYAALVAELFGIELAKSHTRADWSRRPLAPELIDYAAEDVLHLLPAAVRLTTQLEEAGRLQWAIEDSSDLLDTSLYTPRPDTALQRLKAVRHLPGRARAAARRLATWREEEALRRDKPRQWILSDAVLLELATAAPADTAALGRIPGMPPGTARRVGGELLAALAARPDDAREPVPMARPDERHKAKLAEMQARVAACATNLGIQPEVIGSKKELTALLFGEPSPRMLRGWRRDLAGRELLEIAAD